MNSLLHRRELILVILTLFMCKFFYGQIRGNFEFKTPDGNITLNYDSLNFSVDTLKLSSGPYCEPCKYYEGTRLFYLVLEEKFVLTFPSKASFQSWIPVADVNKWEGHYFFAGRMNQDQYKKVKKYIAKKKRFKMPLHGSFQIDDYKLYTLKDEGYLALKKRGGFHYYFPRLIDLLVFLNEV